MKEEEEEEKEKKEKKKWVTTSALLLLYILVSEIYHLPGDDDFRKRKENAVKRVVDILEADERHMALQERTGQPEQGRHDFQFFLQE